MGRDRDPAPEARILAPRSSHRPPSGSNVTGPAPSAFQTPQSAPCWTSTARRPQLRWRTVAGHESDCVDMALVESPDREVAAPRSALKHRANDRPHPPRPVPRHRDAAGNGAVISPAACKHAKAPAGKVAAASRSAALPKSSSATRAAIVATSSGPQRRRSVIPLEPILATRPCPVERDGATFSSEDPASAA